MKEVCVLWIEIKEMTILMKQILMQQISVIIHFCKIDFFNYRGEVNLI